MVDVLELEKRNKEMEEQGLQTAIADQIMLGITKASLATDSFLSAASFQGDNKSSYRCSNQRKSRSISRIKRKRNPW